MNPKLIGHVADALIKLSQMGVQVFILHTVILCSKVLICLRNIRIKETIK